MRKDADWRGIADGYFSARIQPALSIINPSKSDVFYDLGCGYGRPVHLDFSEGKNGHWN